MKLRAIIAATATAAALSTGPLVPLANASSRHVTRTLTFTSVQVATVKFSQTTGASEDKDVNKAGKVIGYDVIRFSFNAKTNTAALDLTVALSNGFLYSALSQSDSPVIHGRLTGGTGAFRGASGTITAKPVGSDGTKTTVTITYRT